MCSTINGSLKLFVGDLGDNRKSDLKRLFSKYGEISTIYYDENKRFAFVEFTSSIDAQRALKHTNNRTVNGSKLRVEYAKSDKTSRDNRRPSSRDRSPTSLLYNHLQVTANRLPSLQIFRQNYYQHYPSTMFSNSNSTSRGRSLTPPSLKQHIHLSSIHHLHTHDFYEQHSNIYSDSNYHRTYGGNPYVMQRLPPPAFFASTSPTRAYRNTYSTNMLNSSRQQRRSRSRHRTSSSCHERKRKRRSSSSSSIAPRGPRTPPLKSSRHSLKKRSRSSSDAIASTLEQKSSSSSNSSSEDEEKHSNLKTYPINETSNRKHSKRK